MTNHDYNIKRIYNNNPRQTIVIESKSAIEFIGNLSDAFVDLIISFCDGAEKVKNHNVFEKCFGRIDPTRISVRGAGEYIGISYGNFSFSFGEMCGIVYNAKRNIPGLSYRLKKALELYQRYAIECENTRNFFPFMGKDELSCFIFLSVLGFDPSLEHHSLSLSFVEEIREARRYDVRDGNNRYTNLTFAGENVRRILISGDIIANNERMRAFLEGRQYQNSCNTF